MHTTTGLWPFLCFFLKQCIISAVSIGENSNFLVLKNNRIIGAAYKEAVTESVLFCAALCQSHTDCTAANYRHETRKCYLINKVCYLNEDVLRWSYLSRPPAPATRTFQYIPSQRTWVNAKSYCKSLGGDLANVKTTADHLEILNILNQLENPPQVWIGGSDRDIEGEWVWSNGCRFEDQDFNFWGLIEPNNANNNEHCLLLRLDAKWNDVDCGRRMHFVCEF